MFIIIVIDFSKKQLEYEKRIVHLRVIGMEGTKTPMGDAGNLRPHRPSKVGMLKPRRPVVTHA